MKIIDIRSDTVTLPNHEMLNTISIDKLGDDVYGEDSLVNELEEKSAKLFKKESALLTTSGTQGNLLGVLSQTNRGDEILLEKEAHIFYYEAAGISVIGGVMPRLISGNKGIINPEEIINEIRVKNDIHQPLSKLISVEQTHNRGGGIVYPINVIDDIGKIAKEQDMAFHMDGARVFNAATYLKTDVSRITEKCSTIQFCLSKGLSAPIGSLLVGSKEIIDKARKYRKMLGGGMRQAGIIAGPGLYALENMTKRLQDDHNNASNLAKFLSSIEGATWDVMDPQTNIIKITTPNGKAKALVDELKKINIKGGSMDAQTVRFVTHCNFSIEDLEELKTRIENSTDLIKLIRTA